MKAKTYKAFVCPSCGYIDRRGNKIVEEVFTGVTRVYVDPNSGEEYDFEECPAYEPRALLCENCGGEIPLRREEKDVPLLKRKSALLTLLVQIEERPGGELFVTPLGDYWKQRGDELKSLLSKRRGVTKVVVTTT